MTYRTTLLLIDGHNLLFRMFFGVPARVLGKDGRPCHGVIGFIGSLLKIARQIAPTHILVVFDSEGGSFRNSINLGYKANRIADYSTQPDTLNPFSQLAPICQSLNALGWRYCEVTGFEADDILSAYAREYGHTCDVILASKDTDLFQLVGGRVSVFWPHGKQSMVYRSEHVEDKFGVPPCYLPDFKALVGDLTDNIAGVPGIGKKTAQRLIGQFGGIEDLLRNITDVSPLRLQQIILEHKATLLQSLSLIKLDQSCPMPFELSVLQVSSTTWERRVMSFLAEIGIL